MSLYYQFDCLQQFIWHNQVYLIRNYVIEKAGAVNIFLPVTRLAAHHGYFFLK